MTPRYVKLERVTTVPLSWEQAHAEALALLRGVQPGTPFLVAIATESPIGLQLVIDGGRRWLRLVSRRLIEFSAVASGEDV